MEQHKQGLLHKPQIIGISLLMEKGIYGLDILVARLRWITGMSLTRVENKGHLSMERKYAQVQSPTRCSRTKPAAKREKPRKRKSCENRGVTPCRGVLLHTRVITYRLLRVTVQEVTARMPPQHFTHRSVLVQRVAYLRGIRMEVQPRFQYSLKRCVQGPKPVLKSCSST